MKLLLTNFKKSRRINTFFFILSITILLICSLTFTNCKGKSSNKVAPRVIVGWQTAWATCGQLIETLVHTNIVELYNSNATFRNFLFGPDMLEAGLGGNIDVVTVGVVPTINLLAASDDWVIVCRLIDFSCITIARSKTDIKFFSDLKSKKLGVPFGSGAHPYIIQRLLDNNLTIGSDPNSVELINVSPAEAVVALQQGSVDALGIWEPNATIIESKGYGKPIDEKRYIGFLVVRKNLVQKYPEQVISLIKSLIEANLYVANNREQTDKWFAERSNFDRDILKKIRVIEPNLNATKIEDISVHISPEDILLSQQVADQMFQSGLIKRKVVIIEHLNLDLAKRAKDEVIKSGSLVSLIKLEGK
jgi:ABC-type nitrate/sulfonate/bicarbonate transport system substrate-binding protein